MDDRKIISMHPSDIPGCDDITYQSDVYVTINPLEINKSNDEIFTKYNIMTLINGTHWFTYDN